MPRSKSFPFLRYPLQGFSRLIDKLPADIPTQLRHHVQEAKFSFRLWRYWWAGQALREEAQRLGRPLHVVDLGCERGWLKHFTPEGVVERWIGLDWKLQPEMTKLGRYDEVHIANFEEPLPLDRHVADVVVSLHVFEHLARPGSAMSEVGRLLKPGGIFLGGAPTMPHWLARFRERHFRKKLAKGQLAAGGHITVLSPSRWRSLATDAGMEVEFATGSYLMRRTGGKLENFKWWARANQAWGALFPSLGSECYIKARKNFAAAAAPARLAPEDPHWRGWWIGSATAMAVALILLAVGLANHLEGERERTILSWLEAHQTGSDIFLIRDDGLDSLCKVRPDLQCSDTVNELLELTAKHPNAHVLVSVPTAVLLAESSQASLWQIDSRMDFDDTDFLLLKRTTHGTSLGEYLLGALGPRHRP